MKWVPPHKSKHILLNDSQSKSNGWQHGFFLPITWLYTCDLLITAIRYRGLPGDSMVKKRKIHLQCRRHRFDSWVRKITLEKEMETHSSILAWKVPWTEESGGLHSMKLWRLDLTTKSPPQVDTVQFFVAKFQPNRVSCHFVSSWWEIKENIDKKNLDRIKMYSL